MFSRLREQFSTTALILSVIALVFALMGGAYAASQPQAKQAKAKQGPRGKTGKTGKTGPAGPAGPAGAPGAKGDAGGAGAPGQNGKSVAVTEIEEGEPECDERGGAEVTQEGASSGVEVCAGEEGSPWTAGGTLPKGATETGTWAFSGTEADTVGTPGEVVPISFPIPLKEVIEEGSQLHFQSQADFADTCKGNAAEPVGGAAHPTAPPSGQLCVYAFPGSILNATFEGIFQPGLGGNGTGQGGAILLFALTGNAYGNGSWAITG